MTPTLLAQYGRFMDEWMMMQQMQQMFGGGQLIYLQIVLTIGFFLIIIFKSERITAPLLMKWAYLTLIASFVMPVLFRLLLNVVVNSLMNSAGGNFSRTSESAWLFHIAAAMEPILVGLSMLLAFSAFSIAPTNQRSQRQPPPTRHPLD